MGYLFAIAVAITYGISSFYMKEGMKNAPGDVGVFYTLVLNAALATFLAVFVIFQNPFIFNWTGVTILVLSGLLGPVIGRMSLYSSIKKLGVTRSAILKNVAPVFSAIIAYLILGESLTLNAMMGIAVVILGLYLLSYDKREYGNPDEKDGNLIKQGIIFGITAALCFALGNVFRKWGLQYINSAVLGLFISINGSLIFYFFYFLVKGKLKELKIEDKVARKNFVIGGLFTCIATFSYFSALTTIPVAVTVTLANTEPIFVLLLSKYYFKQADEPINRRLLISIGIIFLGVLMITLL